MAARANHTVANPPSDPLNPHLHMLRSRLYSRRAKSYLIEQAQSANQPRPLAIHKDSIDTSAVPESVNASLQQHCGGDSTTPVKISRRRPIAPQGFYEEHLSSSLIVGGQLQRDEASLLQQRKASERKEMQAALRLQVAEKRLVCDTGHRHSLPVSSLQSPMSKKQQATYDQSPVLSGSTEDQDTIRFPQTSSVLHTDSDMYSCRQPKESPKVAGFFRRRFKSGHRACNSPLRSRNERCLDLDTAGRSEFLYPDTTPAKQHSGALREVQPHRLCDAESSGRRSFPRHVFKAPSSWKSARPLV